MLGTLCGHKYIVASRKFLPIGRIEEEGGKGQKSVLELNMQHPEKWVIYPPLTDPRPDLARLSLALLWKPPPTNFS